MIRMKRYSHDIWVKRVVQNVNRVRSLKLKSQHWDVKARLGFYSAFFVSKLYSPPSVMSTELST